MKFDFSSKKGVLVVKFAFATAILKIETLRMCRRFARVSSVTFLNPSSQATISLTSSLKECGQKKYMYG